MKKTLIIVKKDCFLYNGNEYTFDSFDQINNLLYTNRKIIILEEELYSKHFSINLKTNKLIKFIENKVNREFPLNRDILYHYEENKKSNAVAIYSLKGGKRIEKITEEANNLEIKPLQFIIKSSVEEMLNNKLVDSKILLEFNGYYYYVELRNGLFYYGFVEKEIDVIINRIHDTENHGDIYIDSKIADKVNFKEKFKIIKINIGDLLNDQIYQKQKFHFRKVL